jgi:hypothetical protein
MAEAASAPRIQGDATPGGDAIPGAAPDGNDTTRATGQPLIDRRGLHGCDILISHGRPINLRLGRIRPS